MSNWIISQLRRVENRQNLEETTTYKMGPKPIVRNVVVSPLFPWPYITNKWVSLGWNFTYGPTVIHHGRNKSGWKSTNMLKKPWLSTINFQPRFCLMLWNPQEIDGWWFKNQQMLGPPRSSNHQFRSRLQPPYPRAPWRLGIHPWHASIGLVFMPKRRELQGFFATVQKTQG